jgi:hypothetical protein
MNVQGILYCDLCGRAIFPEDVAPVKIKVDEVTHEFQYHNHNCHNRDCLALGLDSLKQRFAAAQQ